MQKTIQDHSRMALALLKTGRALRILRDISALFSGPKRLAIVEARSAKV
jgi:hypothetical protein